MNEILTVNNFYIKVVVKMSMDIAHINFFQLSSKLKCQQYRNNYVSQFTVETYCFADGRCLFKQPQSVLYHWNQYDEEISKKCWSVRPSVCPFVTLKKAHSSFIIDSRKIIRISDERVWHPLQENEAIFSEK